MKKYGFIGLGDQGGPMARRMIDAGLPTVLWARRPESLEAYANSSAELAVDIADLARQVVYVGVCVVDDDGVKQVCEQLISNMQVGSCIAIHSTVHPELCRALAAEGASCGVTVIDAPVSGGGMAAADGKLTVMVGGDKSTVESVWPVLETFGSQIVHLGEVGAGQCAKLINNAMLAANISIAYHGLEAAQQLGITRNAFADIVKASSGNSFGFSVAERMHNPQAFSHGAHLLSKDVRLMGEATHNSSEFRVIEQAADSFLRRVQPQE